jgi:hypothetical protein
MAKNITDISIINPLKFRKKGYVNPLPYNTKHFDDWNFKDTIPSFVTEAEYFQPFQKNDIIYLHVLSNYSPHQIEMWSCDGQLVDTFNAGYHVSSIEISGLMVFRVAVALDDYDEGVYHFQVKSGNPVIDTLETEWIQIKELHEDSILFQYTHDENDFGVAFEVGEEFRFRVHGGVTDFDPQFTRRVFADQIESLDQLSSKTFYTEKLFIGGPLGVPPWVIQKVNEIFRCSSILIDGKEYTAIDGAKWEAVREKDFPMAGWIIEVRRTENSGSKRFEADGDQDNETTVVYNMENYGFGTITNPASSNIVQIESLD